MQARQYESGGKGKEQSMKMLDEGYFFFNISKKLSRRKLFKIDCLVYTNEERVYLKDPLLRC